MKKIIAILLIGGLVIVSFSPLYASDWDKAGKVFAGIEGLRVLTGGKVDIIGTITGINRGETKGGTCVKHEGGCVREDVCSRVWVPNIKWKKKWVPEHKEYVKGLGEVIVEGHYIQYKVERGGSWKYTCIEHDGHPDYHHR